MYFKMFFVTSFLISFPIFFISLYIIVNRFVKGKKSVCIVVLGDVGRSPRMQYHALSFATEGYFVDVVGYGGSKIHHDVRDNKSIDVHFLSEPPIFVRYFPRLLAYFAKVIWQSFSLGITLLLIPKCGYTLLQNPPSIPAIAVVWLVRVLRGGTMVIDWHNYGYTILGLALGPGHQLVRFSKWYEHLFGTFASFNICVTNAMKEDLKDNWNVRAVTMYDRPPLIFKETPAEARHNLFTRLAEDYPVFKARTAEPGQENTAFTVKDEDGVTSYLPNRPALVVSSTSWTEDEDFSILLQALNVYEEAASGENSHLPDLVCVITGKGPQKEYYSSKIKENTWQHVSFCLPWLTSEDYPVLLGSADLGVCLHMSSSGLDLPMKVVDMFGCGLPVCAIHFECLPELVHHEENGLVFHDSDQLAQHLQDLLKDFPIVTKKLESMRKNLEVFQSTRWHDTWQQIVLPLFQEENDSVQKKTN